MTNALEQAIEAQEEFDFNATKKNTWCMAAYKQR